MNYIYQQPLNFTSGVGVILGSFSPLHRGHLDLIYRAKKECEGGVLLVVCGYTNDKGWPKMTLKERYQMVRQYFRDDSLVAVYALSDDEMGIADLNEKNSDEWDWDTWIDHLFSDVIATNCPNYNEGDNYANITFYTGEPSYAKEFRARGFKTALLERDLNPISATAIRSNPIKYWRDMAWTYHRKFSHNILITGTSSEGKTTLVEDIGRYFQLPYSKEWARSYIERYMIGDWEFNARDFITFISGQYNHNRDCIESQHNNGIFVADTDCIVTKMYAKYYAQDPDMVITMDEYEHIIEPVADAFIQKSNWDKIFLLMPNHELVDDHVRYMKHASFKARDAMIDILIEELNRAGLWDKVEILPGNYKDNFNRVKEYIESIGGLA